MADALKSNSLSETNQKVYGNLSVSAVGNVSSLSTSRSSKTDKDSKVYDYSAIKLTDSDKAYRMEIKKQSDALLKAAQEITNRFPPLFEQMIDGFSKVQNEIQNSISGNNPKESNSESVTDTKNKQNTSNIQANDDTDKTPSTQIRESAGNTMTIDVEGISNVITNFVDKINDFSKKAGESGSYTAQSAVNQMTTAIEDFEDSLSEIGITSGDSGVAVDQNRLKDSIRNGKAESVLTDENGFAERVSKIAAESGKHSDNFLEKTNTGKNATRPARNTSINYNYITNASIDN